MNPDQNPNEPQQTSTVIDNSTSTDEYVQRKINQIFEQNAFRKKTIEIIKENTGTVEFMKTVQEYADQQIDKRLFKNVKVVLGVIAAWIATGIISFLVAKWTK